LSPFLADVSVEDLLQLLTAAHGPQRRAASGWLSDDIRDLCYLSAGWQAQSQGVSHE